MDDYTASTYGDRVAGVYDDWYAELPFGGDLSEAVSFLGGLAGAGPALELGIGTGERRGPARRLAARPDRAADHHPARRDP